MLKVSAFCGPSVLVPLLLALVLGPSGASAGGEQPPAVAAAASARLEISPSAPPPPPAAGNCPPLAPQGPSVDVSQCTARATGSASCTVSCAPGYTGGTASFRCSLVNNRPQWVGTPPSCNLIPAPGNGYTRDAPQSRFLFGSTCRTYNPNSVNWNAVHDALLAYFARPGTIAPDNIPFSRVASLALRTAFHDAGAFQNGVGGADGSAMLTATEQSWDGNMVPFPFLPYVRAALSTVVSTYGISWADAVVMGGVAGTHFVGGNMPMTVALGRCDSATTNPQVLPGSGVTYRQFAQYWQSVGISLTDAAALLGAHSLIRATGGDPPNWSVEMYTAQLSGGITVVNPSAKFGSQGVTWTNGGGRVWKYTVSDAYNAPSLLNAACAPAPSQCPFMGQFLAATQQFAGSLGRWNGAFAQAYDRMTRIGAKWGPSGPVQFSFVGGRRP